MHVLAFVRCKAKLKLCLFRQPLPSFRTMYVGTCKFHTFWGVFSFGVGDSMVTNENIVFGIIFVKAFAIHHIFWLVYLNSIPKTLSLPAKLR